MLRFVRGTTILFTASTFLDASGASMTPTTVTLSIDYPTGDSGDSRDDTEIVLVNASGNWTGEWESAASEDGQVYWSVWASGTDVVVIDGQLQLTANLANPDP